MRNALLISVLAVGLGAAAPAAAADDALSLTVGTADLDLSKPADAARLRARLVRAATAVCVDPGTRGLQARLALDVCKSAALDGANFQAERAIAAAGTAGNAKIKTARR